MTTLELAIAGIVIWTGLSLLAAGIWIFACRNAHSEPQTDEREAQHTLYGQRPRLGIDRVEHLGGER